MFISTAGGLKALKRPIPSPPNPSQVPSSSASSILPNPFSRRKRKNKISSDFQLNKKPVIFKAVRIEEDTLYEKSCQIYYLKK